MLRMFYSLGFWDDQDFARACDERRVFHEEHLLQRYKTVWLKVEELCGRPLNLSLMQN